MKSSKLIHIVSCHAEGEVGNVIVGGVAPPKGDTLWDKALWINQDQKLRQFVLNEPRGGVFKHVNLLVQQKIQRLIKVLLLWSLNIPLLCLDQTPFVFQLFCLIQE